MAFLATLMCRDAQAELLTGKYTCVIVAVFFAQGSVLKMIFIIAACYTASR
jgi:hypothetical protein